MVHAVVERIPVGGIHRWGPRTGNRRELEVASAGGVWMALAYGFGGLRDHRGELSFDPRLPAAWSRLSFRALSPAASGPT